MMGNIKRINGHNIKDTTARTMSEDLTKELEKILNDIKHLEESISSIGGFIGEDLEERLIALENDIDNTITDAYKQQDLLRNLIDSKADKSEVDTLNGLDEKVAELEQDCNNLETTKANKVDILNLPNLEERVEDLENLSDINADDLQNLEDKVTELEEGYNTLNDTKVDKSEISSLPTLGDRLAELEDHIKNIYEEDWYIPNTQTGALLGDETIPSEYTTDTYEGFYDWILNPLVSNYPDYVSKEPLGQDTTNTYNIYRYNFTPKYYEKTVLIFSCLHGNEYTSFFGLCKFLKELCERDDDPNLNYLKNKIQLVVVPIANPWGFVNSKRQNSNGVDLNRNFDYRWDEYTSEKGQIGQVYYKGTEPFSEIESQIIKRLVESLLEENLVASIDFHTITTIQAEKILYYPRFINNCHTALSEVVKRFKYGENRTIFSSSAVPSLTNYMCWAHGISGCNPEWCNKCYHPTGQRDFVNMTLWVEWAGNVILALAKTAKYAGHIPAQPFLKSLYFNADPTITVEDENNMTSKGYRILKSDTYNSMEISKYEFTLDQQHIIRVDGFLRIIAEKDAEVHIQPMLYQQYSPEQKYSTVKSEERYGFNFNVKEGQEYMIPIKACLLGFHSNYNDEESARAAKIHFRIRAKTSVVNSAYIASYNVMISGIPSDRGASVSIEEITETGITTIFPTRIQEDIED